MHLTLTTDQGPLSMSVLCAVGHKYSLHPENTINCTGHLIQTNNHNNSITTEDTADTPKNLISEKQFIRKCIHTSKDRLYPISWLLASIPKRYAHPAPQSRPATYALIVAS